MSKRSAAVVLLAAAIVVYRGAELWRGFSGVPGIATIGFDLSVSNGALSVTQVRPTGFSDGRPSPAKEADIRVGDRIVAWEDGTGKREPIVGLASYGRAMWAVSADPRAALLLDGGAGNPGRTVIFHWHARSRKLWVLAIYAFLVGVLPLMAVATALLIVALRPDDGVGLLGSILFLGFSAVFGAEYWLLPAGLRDLAALTQTTLSISFCYVFMRFFLVFPAAGSIDRRMPWLKHLLLIPTLTIAVASTVFSVAALYSADLASRMLGDRAGALFGEATLVLMTAMVSIGIVSGLWEALHAPTPGDRRRLAIMIAGAMAGLVPIIVVSVYAMAAGTQTLAPWMLFFIIPTLPLFPLSFIYAVVRHRVLGVPVILRSGLQYLLVSRGFLVFEGLVIFLALYLGVGPLLAEYFPASGAGAIAATNAIATAVVLAGVNRLNGLLKPALDRRFFREPYKPQQVLDELGSVCQASATDPHALVSALAQQLARALHVRSAAVFVRRDQPPFGLRADDSGAGPTTFTCEAWLGEREVPADPLHADPWEAQPDRSFESAGPIEVFELEPVTSRTWPRRVGLANDLPRLIAMGVRLAAPIRTVNTVFGWLLLGDKRSEEAYSSEDRALVRAAVQQAATALDYATLIGRMAEQQALRRELDIARQVQAGLFPQRRPPLRSLDYDGTCQSAREVGGDYFDFMDVGERRFAMAVGDIAGKGVSAALLMSNLQAMLRSQAPSRGADPASLMRDVNRLLVDATDPSKFATLFYAVYDDDTGRLTYVNAGHNPPIVRRAGGCIVRLQPTGMAMGFSERAEYPSAEIDLTPGDVLVIFTDGLTEAQSASGEEFGEERTLAALERSASRTASGMMESLLEEVRQFCGPVAQYDDITLVIARVRERG